MQFGQKLVILNYFEVLKLKLIFVIFGTKQQKVDNIVPILLSLYNKLQNAKDKLERCSKTHLKA